MMVIFSVDLFIQNFALARKGSGRCKRCEMRQEVKILSILSFERLDKESSAMVKGSYGDFT